MTVSDHRLQKADVGEQHSDKGAFEQRVEKGQGCSHWNSVCRGGGGDEDRPAEGE